MDKLNSQSNKEHSHILQNMRMLKMFGGFLTLELMISLALIISVLSATVLVSSGNQSYLTGTEINGQGLGIAEGLIEKAKTLARKDFNLVNTNSLTNEDGFEKELTVKQLPDFTTKEVTSSVHFKDEHQIPHSFLLTTLLTNFEIPFSSNTCDSTLLGNWQNPIIESTIEFSNLHGIPVGKYTLTDVDVYKGYLYVTAGKTSGQNDPTFFIFDISNPTNPSLVSKTDNASGVVFGLNAIRVSEDASNPSKKYAFVSSATASNYSTCDPVTNPACGELYILDVTSPTGIISSINLKILTNPAITGQTSSTSIFYKNGYVLLGLTATSGPEFNVLDVRNPSIIFTNTSHTISALGSYEVGNGINALLVRNNYAYLATPNTEELKVLNIATPGAPFYVNGFSLGTGNGKSLNLVGDKLYFGRTTATGEDFQILDVANPGISISKRGGKDVGSSVNSILVRDYFSFVLTNNSLKVYDTTDASDIVLSGILPLPVNGNSIEPSMDCEGNRIYISTNDASGAGIIYIIKPEV